MQGESQPLANEHRVQGDRNEGQRVPGCPFPSHRAVCVWRGHKQELQHVIQTREIGSESSARGSSSPRDRDAAAHDVLGRCFPAGMGSRVQLFMSLLVLGGSHHKGRGFSEI